MKLKPKYLKNIFVIICMFLFVIRNNIASELPTAIEKKIPGLNPVDVYLNFEKRGYTISKDFNPGLCIWSCNKKIGEPSNTIDGVIFYSVECSGNNANSVKRINANISCNVKNVVAIAKPEFVYLASVPYEGSLPREAQKWISDNIGKKSKKTFNGVVFDLFMASEKSCCLSIYPEVEEKTEDKTEEKKEPLFRIWKSVDEKFSIEAIFLQKINGVIELKKTDGKIIKVPLEKISNEDINWINNYKYTKSNQSNIE